MEGKKRLYVNLGAQPEFDARVMNWVNSLRAKTRQGAKAPAEFVMLNHLLHVIYS